MQYIYLLIEGLLIICAISILFLDMNMKNRYIRYKSVVSSYRGLDAYSRTFKKSIKKLEPINRLYKRYINEKKDKELYFIILQLQNIVLSKKDEQVTMIYMVSNVLKFCDYTEKAFLQFIYFYNLDDKEAAVEAFRDHIPSNIARDLIYIISEMDNLDPRKVMDQFSVLEDRVKMDMNMKKNIMEEKLSNFLYVLPVCLCFLIMLNFVLIIMQEVSSMSL